MHPSNYAKLKEASQASADDDHLLTSNQVCAHFGGIAHMTLWRWEKDPELGFPQKLKIQTRNYWRLGDLRRWQAAQATKQVVA